VNIIEGIWYYYSRFGIKGASLAIKARLFNSEEIIEVKRPGIKFPFYLRCLTSDIVVSDQVFVDLEYDFQLKESPKVIVDTGANIGLTSIYFANKYPDAQIIAIEPENGNYEALKKNVSPYTNIRTINAALWNKNEEINLIDPGRHGNCGFRTDSKESPVDNNYPVCQQIQAITIDKIMEEYQLVSIDILKLDIEGAEIEVFSTSDSWIGKVNALIIELHDRLRPGCSRSFYNGSNGFDYEWQKDNIVFIRRNTINSTEI